MPSYLGYGLFIISAYILRSHIKKFRQPAPLPPGPRGLPIIGNVADMPKGKDWLTYAEWGRKYGGICSVNVGGQVIIIVNSPDIVDEIEKNGALYSNRPRLEMGGELLGFTNMLVLLQYGDRFRLHRKHLAKYIGGIIQVKELYPIIQSSTRKFLRWMLAKPDDLMLHLRKLQAVSILKLTYGIDVQEEGEDPYVGLIDRANSNFSKAAVPGAYLVDFFPMIKKLPEWLPGMGFMEKARRWARDTLDMVETPYGFTVNQIDAGMAPKSYISTTLEDDNLTAEDIHNLKYSAASLCAGGTDTMVIAESAFILAMILYPEVQKKAQAELDTVVGNDRLPTLEDLPHLPYINALATEVLRWNAVTPTGFPHTAAEDSILAGYFIPKGAMIICNLWNMLHDETIWPEPFEFSPERYLGPNPQQDPRGISFGFARRVCPGMYLADAALAIAIAMTLAAFDITNAVDEDGVPIVPKHENQSGTASYLEPFGYKIKPRSEAAAALIMEEI